MSATRLLFHLVCLGYHRIAKETNFPQLCVPMLSTSSIAQRYLVEHIGLVMGYRSVPRTNRMRPSWIVTWCQLCWQTLECSQWPSLGITYGYQLLQLTGFPNHGNLMSSGSRPNINSMSNSVMRLCLFPPTFRCCGSGLKLLRRKEHKSRLILVCYSCSRLPKKVSNADALCSGQSNDIALTKQEEEHRVTIEGCH